jgi:hypothetical protein
MTDNFGPAVSRVLDPSDRQFELVTWAAGRPPTDSCLNLIGQIAYGAFESVVLRGMPSGWLGNETSLQAMFGTNPSFSNYFEFGVHRSGELASLTFANVAGMLIPVAGTKTASPPGTSSTDTVNLITLSPPPSTDFRTDFVFLEVWRARIQPNPSTTNKPSASGIWKFGAVESGFAFCPDDLQDPSLGFPTEERIQIQYRIRVVDNLLGLSSNPDGFDPNVVKAQGAAAAPTSYVFTNQRVNGDVGLWRAGNGDPSNGLGTVDGYAYAIPISAVFRRNASSWNSSNLNGGFNRNPTATDRTGFKTFSTIATLATDLTATATSATLVSATNIPLPASLAPAVPILIQIGDELLTYQTIIGTTLNTLVRGVNGTYRGIPGVGESHKAGTVVRILSGRPDGLFSDQIVATDILDLRHMVNPNGFDYTALLKSNLDKLLRGQLRANWKRSGSGTQGPFVFYSDAIQAAAVPLGITQLDAPDNIRMVFSDAATIQPIECVVSPAPSSAPPIVDINVSWSLGITVKATFQLTSGAFTAGDILTVPIAQTKNGLQAGSTDQVRWLNDSVVGAITLRLDGETGDLPSSVYTVTPAVPAPDEDLVITLTSDFPTQTDSDPASPKLLHIKIHAVYGPGRGLSRKPDSIHSISYLNPSADLLVQQWGIPGSYQGSRVAWAPLWSKSRSSTFNNMLPVTSEMYADLGSKTVIVSPFRRIDFDEVTPLTIDGNAANPEPTAKKTSATGITAGLNSAVLNDASGTAPAAQYDALVIPSGPGAGRYTIISSPGPTSYTLDRPIRAKAGVSISYTVHSAQGVMPLNKVNGTPKWTMGTDPLGLFCSQSAGNLAYNSIYVSLPRHLVPGWGEVRVPILANNISAFSQGINYITNSKSGSTYVDADKNYVNYDPSPTRTYASFTTADLNTLAPAIYNADNPYAGAPFAGMRFFTDIRGLGRQGLELPPFYGIARLFAVYEAADYKASGSAFDPTTRALSSGATNLLRQSMNQSDGPTMWIEIDDDKDSTFILNANAIDITKSPNPIASFSAGNYVIEASIFGFDRGTFDLNSEVRLVLTRPGSNSWSSVGGGAPDLIPANRANNINKYVAGPSAILPGPAEPSDQILINFSRVPYSGDPWGSTNTYQDLPYTPGPLTSGNAYQVVSTSLDQEALTRPNQKVLEVLAATSFATTLGTGRYAGDASIDPLNFLDVCYEDPTAYPPTSSVADRPKAFSGNFSSFDTANVGTNYSGATERLPLGALFRDKDFRGNVFSYLNSFSPVVFSDLVGNGSATGLATQSQLEQEEIFLNTASSGVCSPGDVLVHVDGEQNNYSLLTNFRTHRGGSAFTALGSHLGGSIAFQNVASYTGVDHVTVLQSRAMLVRNAVTNVGATEVSAGDELMMLIITNVQRLVGGIPEAALLLIGTNGDGEGYAAADVYRIEGHPLVRNNVRMIVDPTTVELAKKV